MTTPFSGNPVTYRVDVLTRAVDLNAAPLVHLGISLQNPKHRAAKLDALIGWATTRCAEVQVNLHDTIQRHNIAFMRGDDPEVVRAEARKLGDAWIEENGPVLRRHPQARLVRHDDMVAAYPHAERLQALTSLYAANPTFRLLVDNDIRRVTDRRCTQFAWGEATQARFEAASRDYILDELALMSLLNEHEQFVEAYPGRFLTLLHDPRRLTIPGLPAGLRHYPMIEVDFVRRKTPLTAVERAA